MSSPVYHDKIRTGPYRNQRFKVVLQGGCPDGARQRHRRAPGHFPPERHVNSGLQLSCKASYRSSPPCTTTRWASLSILSRGVSRWDSRKVSKNISECVDFLQSRFCDFLRENIEIRTYWVARILTWTRSRTCSSNSLLKKSFDLVRSVSVIVRRKLAQKTKIVCIKTKLSQWGWKTSWRVRLCVVSVTVTARGGRRTKDCSQTWSFGFQFRLGKRFPDEIKLPSGRAASGGTLAPEPPRATRNTPEFKV